MANKLERSPEIFYTKNNETILIHVENAINNISYPLSHLLKLFGCKVVYWGHGRDLNNPGDNSIMRKVIESLKLFLVKSGDGFFAYTQSVKKYLAGRNVSSEKIIILNNTINILKSRHFLSKNIESKKTFKKLVFTGRLNKSKRIDFLLNSFKLVKEIDAAFELHIIGDGDEKYKAQIADTKGVIYHGQITDDEKLANIYKHCDFYTYPGYIGLGALHAMCFDLIPIVIDSNFHKPEFDYINTENSIILPKGSNELQFANRIIELSNDSLTILDKKNKIWNTIKHLTIDNMARNFSKGIEKVLSNKSS